MYFKDQQTTERAVEESIKQVSDGGDAAPLTSKVELAEDTVVDVINKHRMGLKKKLRKLVAVTKRKAVVEPKYEEWKEIFGKCGEDMEWEEIEKEADVELRILWRQVTNFFKTKVIKAVESHDVIKDIQR
ncbi:hypothetical protein RhiirA4_418534 [Rhizophagus irregularis]|uniref:Uncharacterized protein n=1 Tax=Rhizophagus irregularis TaxID=588596 RepID=A0A2I1GAW1_9GLOM|nr:hypothetical protein RhiirA4_418534 [Rhizophagus irregularis]